MTHSQPATGSEEPTTGRFVLGAGVFVFGMLCPLMVPLVATSELSTEWKTALSGVLLLGAPEVFMLIAVAILGKPGFEAMKRKLLQLIPRLSPTTRVGPVRHRIGVVMFALPPLIGWLEPYVAVWIAVPADLRLPVAIVADVVFVASFFVLGGDFWHKLSGLFVRSPKGG